MTKVQAELCLLKNINKEKKMKVYEIYCNDDKEYFFVTHESGQAFSVDSKHIDGKSKKVYIAATSKFYEALKKVDELLSDRAEKYKNIRGPVNSVGFEIDEKGVLSSRMTNTVQKQPIHREHVGLFNSLMVIKGNSKYAEKCAKQCCYVVRDDGSLERLQKPVVVYCTIAGKDVASIIKRTDNAIYWMKRDLTSVYQKAAIVARNKYNGWREEIKSGTLRYAVQLFTKNKEFRERFDSGEYGLITDGCPELNGKDGVYSYIFVKLSPEKNYRLATNCNWVFEQYAEYVRNFPGLSASQVNNFLKQIPNQRSTVRAYLHNDTVRKLYNEVMSFRANGRGTCMMCYDKSTDEIVLLEEY